MGHTCKTKRLLCYVPTVWVHDDQHRSGTAQRLRPDRTGQMVQSDCLFRGLGEAVVTSSWKVLRMYV